MKNTKKSEAEKLQGEDLKEIAHLVVQEISQKAKTAPEDLALISKSEGKSSIDKKDDFKKPRPTGIAEFDEMLHGGFPSDSTILLAGASGTGKTILSMQWLFEGYKKYGESGLYISLTEPINKVIKNMEKFSFADKNNITVGKVHIEDLRTIMFNLDISDKVLIASDLDKIIDKLADILMETGAKRVVIDSITAICYRLQDKHLIRTFIYHLDSLLAQNNVNVILTSEVVGAGFSVFGVEEFISDGIIKLTRKMHKNERVNKLQVVKMRGTDFDTHSASYRITQKGFNLYPRLVHDLVYNVSEKRISTGVNGLDAMTCGGYFEGSSILITGSSGTGKTLLSSQFLLQGLKDGKNALLVSFEESRDQILRNTRSFGWDFEGYERAGKLKMLVSYPEQKYLEEHIDIIRDEIEKNKINLVVVDSLSSLGNVFSEDVLRDFVSRLNSYMKGKLVTSIFTNATSSLLGATQITDSHLSTITDQIIMLRYVEIESELRHALLILKMRGSRHDKKLRELDFTPQGVSITQEFSGFEGVLSGTTRKVSETVAEQIKGLFVEYLGPMGEQMFENEKGKGLSSESVKKMIVELGNQGIISERRKEEFLTESSEIFEKHELGGGV